MIQCLLEATEPAGRPTRVDQRVGDRLVENGLAHMMRTGERREQSAARKQLERAHVQLAISAQGVAQSAFVLVKEGGSKTITIADRAY